MRNALVQLLNPRLRAVTSEPPRDGHEEKVNMDLDLIRDGFITVMAPPQESQGC